MVKCASLPSTLDLRQGCHFMKAFFCDYHGCLVHHLASFCDFGHSPSSLAQDVSQQHGSFMLSTKSCSTCWACPAGLEMEDSMSTMYARHLRMSCRRHVRTLSPRVLIPTRPCSSLDRSQMVAGPLQPEASLLAGGRKYSTCSLYSILRLLASSVCGLPA